MKEVSAAQTWEVDGGVAPICVLAPHFVQSLVGCPGDTARDCQGPHDRNHFAEEAQAFQNLLP